MEKQLIGVFNTNTFSANIYDKTIKNPYSIYLPRTENGKLKEFIYIDDITIANYLYDIFISKYHKKQIINNKDVKLNMFLSWIYKFNGVSKSNWYVVVKNMFRNNNLN